MQLILLERVLQKSRQGANTPVFPKYPNGSPARSSGKVTQTGKETEIMKIIRKGTMSEVGDMMLLGSLGEEKLRELNTELGLPGHDSPTAHPTCIAWMGLSEYQITMTMEIHRLP